MKNLIKLSESINLKDFPLINPFESLVIPLKKAEEDASTGSAVVLTANLPLLNSLLDVHNSSDNAPIANVATYSNPDSKNGEGFVVESRFTDKSVLITTYVDKSNHLKISGILENEKDFKLDLNSLGKLGIPVYVGLLDALFLLETSETKLLKDSVNGFLEKLVFAKKKDKNKVGESTLKALDDIYIISKILEGISESVSTDFYGDEKELVIPRISNSALKSMKENIKEISGNFSFLDEIKLEEAIIDVDLSKLSFHKGYKELSVEEQLLIPSIPDGHFVGKDEAFISKQIKNSFKLDDEGFKIHNILLEGEAGSGKSQLARVLASKMKRPFVSFSCSENTDESDLKGLLLPSISDESFENLTEKEQKIYSLLKENSESLYDEVGKVLGLPDAFEIEISPTESYNKMAETNVKSADSFAAMKLFYDLIFKEIKKLTNKLKGKNDGVTYRYIDSPIMRAIKNGWVLELQEVTLVRQQSIFSALFDVLERTSIGIVNTQVGSIKRHPDFFCIVTTNSNYYGCKPMNEAFRSRFQLAVKLDTPDHDEIKERVKSKCNVQDDDNLEMIASIYDSIKETIKNEDIRGDLSLRNLFQFAVALDGCKSFDELDSLILNYLVYSVTTNKEDVDLLLTQVKDNVNLSI